MNNPGLQPLFTGQFHSRGTQIAATNDNIEPLFRVAAGMAASWATFDLNDLLR
jgi:hypothetical protein